MLISSDNSKFVRLNNFDLLLHLYLIAIFILIFIINLICYVLFSEKEIFVLNILTIYCFKTSETIYRFLKYEIQF